MELLLISEKKLKIMLTKEDMESYNLRAENLDYGLKNTRETLDGIFELAKRKTGFEVKKGRLFVQAYPSLDGGCEIYLTRLEDEISGFIEEGSVDNCILSVYKTEENATKGASCIRSNPNVDDVNVYKDIYNGTYLVTVKLKKSVSEDNQNYIKAFFSEIGSTRSAILRRETFSKERYKLIRSL